MDEKEPGEFAGLFCFQINKREHQDKQEHS